MKLNVYLFQDTVTNFKDCLLEKTAKRSYKKISNAKKSVGFEYAIYLVKREHKDPSWLKHFQSYIDTKRISGFDLKNHNVAIVTLVKVTANSNAPARYFAITNGHSSHILDYEKIVTDFGLKTTLNSIDPEKLKLIDAKNIDVQTMQKRVASNRNTRLGELGFESDIDILRLVTGLCSDPTLGTRISGADNLQISARKLKFTGIGDKCLALYGEFNKSTYQKNFDFLDRIKQVKSKQLVARLDGALVKAINTRLQTAKISTAYPDQIEYEKCDEFSITGTRRQARYTEIYLSTIYKYLNANKSLSIDDVKSKIRIVGLNSQGSACTKRESLYSYMVFETILSGKTYVFSGRKWYIVEKDYIKKLNNHLTALVKAHTATPLSPWTQSTQTTRSGTTTGYFEGDYNETYASNLDFLVLDKKNFTRQGYGHSQIEIADLFCKSSNSMICVKKSTRSSTLSHLFSQGSVSAELLKGEPPYRKEVSDRLRHRFPSLSKPNIDDITFVFAIGTDKVFASHPVDMLPVFSKITLYRHARRINLIGFNVEIIKIDMV